MKLNCLIIDDEPVARKGLEEYVRAIDCVTLLASCENTGKASDLITNNSVDLIFLDIQMPGQTGIEFLKSLVQPPMAIFTTAFSNYAVESYDLNVIDYLVKPIPFERFKRAVLKAYDFHKLRHDAGTANTEQYFFIKSEGKFEKVLFDEVTYIEALQNYVVIHTHARKMITYITLSGIESQLPHKQFLKVHKSYIISVVSVTAIEGNEIRIGDKRIPISRMLKDEVLNYILGNNLFKR